MIPALQYLKAASCGAEPAAVLRAETAIEELLTNSVVHGAGARSPGARIWLGVAASGAALKLRYEDNGPAFDPLPVVALALQYSGNPLEQRSAGGLGLLMVYRLADAFLYTDRKSVV